MASRDVLKVVNQKILMLIMLHEGMHQDSFLSIFIGVCTLTAAYCELRGVWPEPYVIRNRNPDLSQQWLEEFGLDVAQKGLCTHRFVIEKFAKAKKKPKQTTSKMVSCLCGFLIFVVASLLFLKQREIRFSRLLIVIIIHI